MGEVKRLIIIVMLAGSFAGFISAFGETKKDPNQLFYAGNNYYEKGEYDKAIEEHLKILDLGIEGGNLYYNIGNSFFKLGKLGYAILCYERAKRLMPQDRDLRSNLAYAKSLTAEFTPESSVRSFVLELIKRPFRDFSLNNIAICASVLYIIVILITAIFILNRFIARKFFIPYLILLTAFLINTAAFGIRYYSERVLRHAIVLQKDVECKYEPIDKSTTHYTLQEGGDVGVLKDRNGWRQIKRPDGKIGWVKGDAVEVI